MIVVHRQRHFAWDDLEAAVHVGDALVVRRRIAARGHARGDGVGGGAGVRRRRSARARQRNAGYRVAALQAVGGKFRPGKGQHITVDLVGGIVGRHGQDGRLGDCAGAVARHGDGIIVAAIAVGHGVAREIYRLAAVGVFVGIGQRRLADRVARHPQLRVEVGQVDHPRRVTQRAVVHFADHRGGQGDVLGFDLDRDGSASERVVAVAQTQTAVGPGRIGGRIAAGDIGTAAEVDRIATEDTAQREIAGVEQGSAVVVLPAMSIQDGDVPRADREIAILVSDGVVAGLEAATHGSRGSAGGDDVAAGSGAGGSGGAGQSDAAYGLAVFQACGGEFAAGEVKRRAVGLGLVTGLDAQTRRIDLERAIIDRGNVVIAVVPGAHTNDLVGVGTARAIRARVRGRRGRTGHREGKQGLGILATRHAEPPHRVDHLGIADVTVLAVARHVAARRQGDVAPGDAIAAGDAAQGGVVARQPPVVAGT